MVAVFVRIWEEEHRDQEGPIVLCGCGLMEHKYLKIEYEIGLVACAHYILDVCFAALIQPKKWFNYFMRFSRMIRRAKAWKRCDLIWPTEMWCFSAADVGDELWRMIADVCKFNSSEVLSFMFWKGETDVPNAIRTDQFDICRESDHIVNSAAAHPGCRRQTMHMYIYPIQRKWKKTSIIDHKNRSVLLTSHSPGKHLRFEQTSARRSGISIQLIHSILQPKTPTNIQCLSVFNQP